MTTYKDWSCWTYVLVDGYLASGGCILDFDFEKKWIQYQRYYHYPKEGQNINVPIEEAQFQEVWIDPERRSILEKEIIMGFDEAKVPESFIKLTDQDPKEYFGGIVTSDSTYLLRDEDV